MSNIRGPKVTVLSLIAATAAILYAQDNVQSEAVAADQPDTATKAVQTGVRNGTVFSYQALLPINDPIVRLIKELYDSAGMVLPAYQQPWSVAQTLDMLDRLEAPNGTAAWNANLVASIFGPENKQADPSRHELIKSIRATLAGRDLSPEPRFGLNVSLGGGFEAYLSNTDASTVPWEYGWNQRMPLVKLELQSAFKTNPDDPQAFGVWGVLDLVLKEEHNTIERVVNPANTSNWLEDGTYFDAQFPFRAVVTAGTDNISLTVGRDKLDIGNGQWGNLAVSDNPDYYDYLRLQMGSGYIRYTGLWINMDPSVDNLAYLLPVNKYNGAQISQPEYELAKNFFMHRLDLSFWDKIHVGLTEGILVGGIAPELKYFNPFITFHDLFPWLDTPNFISASSVFAFEATANPFQWLSLWFQYAQNQYQSDFERQHYSDAADIPNANATLAGARISFPIAQKLSTDAEDISGTGQSDGIQPPLFLVARGPLMFSLAAEFAETNPWMYIRENIFNSFFWRRRLASNVPNSFQFENESMGWKLGPDSRSLQTAISLERYKLFDANLGFEHREQGENNILTAYAEGPTAVALSTPSGTVQISNILSLSGSFWLTHRPVVSLSWDLEYIWIDNFAHLLGNHRESMQAALGISFTL